MKRWGLSLVIVLGCAPRVEPEPQPDEHEELSGGALTVFDETRDAYARPAPNLRNDFSVENRFFVGNSFFNQNWVTAPGSAEARDGLGPTFNATSCSACHFKDGRGAPPDGDEPFLGLLLRLSVPGVDEHGGPLDVPAYGGQFNHRAIPGVSVEGSSHVTYESVAGTYDDGTPYTLQRPRYTFTDLAFGPMPDDVMVSPRVAPATFGLGLLEAVAEEDIVARADPDDADGDGISGRPNRVWDPLHGTVALGRFGWKANQAGLEQQNTGAMLGDLGITSPLHPVENCPAPQLECASATTGGSPEIEQSKVDAVTFYTQVLAVPARRRWDASDVRRGRELFTSTGCAACHVPRMHTRDDAEPVEVAGQDIRPFTDLLLHDMGEELADGRPDFLADGREWRTPPLWGLGLMQTVNRHTRLLHDGRARNAEEAILWHGGEAASSQQRFKALRSDERAALLAFLGSL